jgi:hypothetical protein
MNSSDSVDITVISWYYSVVGQFCGIFAQSNNCGAREIDTAR